MSGYVGLTSAPRWCMDKSCCLAGPETIRLSTLFVMTIKKNDKGDKLLSNALPNRQSCRCPCFSPIYIKYSRKVATTPERWWNVIHQIHSTQAELAMLKNEVRERCPIDISWHCCCTQVRQPTARNDIEFVDRCWHFFACCPPWFLFSPSTSTAWFRHGMFWGLRQPSRTFSGLPRLATVGS